jgi:1-aminocyclopropane-1-carboxylate deaminase/D-cysteine desulfhydrase-like pyridoxal-dependent ACC family enzyme
MVAAAARRLGMDCHLLVSGSPPDEVTGNLLLDRILGATLTFLSMSAAELTPQRVEEAYGAAEERLRSMGKRPFRIAPGASTPLGVMGYRRAFEEVMAQAAGQSFAPDRLVVAVGTGGTLAGLVLGNILAGRPCRITGISIAPAGIPEALGVAPAEELVREGAALLGRDVTAKPGDIDISYAYGGRAYAVPTPEGIEAIRALARAEGVMLDPVYTGKAMAGFLDLCRGGQIAPAEQVVFMHTGGTPGLFAYSKVLAP